MRTVSEWLCFCKYHLSVTSGCLREEFDKNACFHFGSYVTLEGTWRPPLSYQTRMAQKKNEGNTCRTRGALPSEPVPKLGQEHLDMTDDLSKRYLDKAVFIASIRSATLRSDSTFPMGNRGMCSDIPSKFFLTFLQELEDFTCSWRSEHRLRHPGIAGPHEHLEQSWKECSRPSPRKQARLGNFSLLVRQDSCTLNIWFMVNS